MISKTHISAQKPHRRQLNTKVCSSESAIFLILLSLSRYVPINGMPHLAYLGQMLKKEGEFGIGIFPEGLVLSRDCQNES